VKRLALLIGLTATLSAHVGSPDIFYEGKAGPYPAMVTIRPPNVIPGVAEVEIRIPVDGVRQVRIVPLPLTGAGSNNPPTPDIAKQDKQDPHFFTGSVWLMAFGSYQVRVDVDGAEGAGRLSVPVPAIASLVTKIDPALGGALIVMMVLLAAGMVAIAGAALRDSPLPPGESPSPQRRRAGRIAMAATTLVLAALVFFGFRWWNSDERDYLGNVYKPLEMAARVDGGRLTLKLTDPGWLRFRKTNDFIPDHGHLMHLFAIRMPDMDRMWHLHPEPDPNADDSTFALDLPDMAAGRYKLFADVVHENGFPETPVSEISVPEIHGRALSGDDADGSGPPLAAAAFRAVSPLRDGYRMVWVNAAPELKSRAATRFTFRVEDEHGNPATDMQLYMGMVGHAEFINADATVFAHVHPDGSVPMASLMLTRVSMQHPHGPVPAEISFPYGFPKPGRYRIFVQMQRAGHPETGVFDVRVD
jgi:hypothetical protein